MSYYSHTKELLNGRVVAANHTKVVGIINRNKAGYSISTTYIAPVWGVPHFHDAESASC